MYFPPAFFDISVHLTTHLIKEIKLLGHMFLHQMYAYERFNGILKSFVRNRAYPEGSMVQGYCTDETVEWALNYADPSNPIGVPKSHHEGRLTGKGTIWKKDITPDPYFSATLISTCCNKCSLCLSTWMRIRRCYLETILAIMNHG
jgi:hypothetical protein